MSGFAPAHHVLTFGAAGARGQTAAITALLERHGAVSAPVARAMAEGGLIAGDADHALAATGIAGPAGGSEAKPVGTVYIARSARRGATVDTDIRRFHFPGSRDDVRERSAVTALNMLRLHLLSADGSPLAWQKIDADIQSA